MNKDLHVDYGRKESKLYPPRVSPHISGSHASFMKGIRQNKSRDGRSSSDFGAKRNLSENIENNSQVDDSIREMSSVQSESSLQESSSRLMDSSKVANIVSEDSKIDIVRHQAQRIRDSRELEYELQGMKPKRNQVFLYTPVLLRDPRNFTSLGYSLHQKKIKLFVAITMYNEKPDELILTLRGVCENIRTLMRKTGNMLFWKNVAVCIISDGREKANPDTLQFLESIGLYNQVDVNNSLDTYDMQHFGAHLFEGTAVFVDHPDLDTLFPPLQMIFALKEHNAGKIDSHWWFFEAFSKFLNPEYCFVTRFPFYWLIY